MVKAIIFDMDGLMIDSEKINYHFFNNYFQLKGFSLTPKEYCYCFTGKTITIGLDTVRKLCFKDFDDYEFYDYVWQHKDEWENQIIPLKQGLIELLNYLKERKIKIAIATSSHRSRVNKIFSNYDVLSYVDYVVTGEDVKESKPAPDIFLKACELLQLNREEVIVLEDSEAGIEAAYRGNIRVICIPDMKVPAEKYLKMTEAVLPTLKDVIYYLE